MVVDRADAERAHAGDDHRSVKGGETQNLARHDAEIIQKAQQSDCPAAEQPGDQGQDFVQAIELIAVVGGFPNGGHGAVELFVDFVHGVIRLEVDLDAGIGGVDCHPLFDHHHDLDALAGVDFLPADKAVEGGTLGDGADVRGNENMQKAEIRHARANLFATEAVGLGHIDRICEVVAGVGALGHDVRHHSRHGVDGTEFVAVRAVAPMPPTFFLLGSVFHRSLTFGFVNRISQNHILYYKQKKRNMQGLSRKKSCLG